MYRRSTQPTTPNPNHSKKNPKPLNQPTSLDRKNETHTSQFKNRDEQLLAMIREHLQLNGYLRTAETLKNEKPSLRARTNLAPMHQRSDIDKNHILVLFDRGSRQDFFKHASKLFIGGQESIRKLQFELNVYFCIYGIHPCLRRQNSIEKSCTEAFKRYLDTKGSDLSGTQQFLPYFALAFMSRPQENVGLSHLFSKQWLSKTRTKLIDAINTHIKHPPNQHQAPPQRKASALQEMHHQLQQRSGEESKENQCNHVVEMEALQHQNHELKGVIEGLQKKFGEFVESSKANLMQSGQKWFVFSREIYAIAKKYLRKEHLPLLDKYDSFFLGSMDQHIEANEISLFDKHSYVNQQSSLSENRARLTKKPTMQHAVQNPGAIDLSRIRSLFLQANLKDREIDICTVLKALRFRIKRKSEMAQRREVMVEYSRGDVCGVGQDNYSVQKRLLFDGSHRIRLFYVKLVEVLTNNVAGLQYLSKSKKLVENLVGLFSIEKEESRCRKPVLGILQRLSFSKGPREQMVQLGIIPMIFRVLRQEGEHISDFTLQFLIAMMMNLSLKRESKKDFEEHRAELVTLVIEQMGSDNENIRNYVNGTIFLLLTSPIIKQEALRQQLDQVVSQYIDSRPDDLCIQQYHYILSRLSNDNQSDGNQSEEDDEEEEEVQGYEDEEQYESMTQSSSEEDADDLQIAKGDDLLVKNYALVGPQAVKEHILTRSVLDETSKRLNNMTTSINRSRRLDNIFQHKNNATVLEPELDCLLNRKK